MSRQVVALLLLSPLQPSKRTLDLESREIVRYQKEGNVEINVEEPCSGYKILLTPKDSFPKCTQFKFRTQSFRGLSRTSPSLAG